LPNKNESATVAKSQKFLQLNGASSCLSLRTASTLAQPPLARPVVHGCGSCGPVVAPETSHSTVEGRQTALSCSPNQNTLSGTK